MTRNSIAGGIALLGVGIVGGLAYGSLPVSGSVFKLGEYLCAPNEGLQRVETPIYRAANTYTFYCNNTARFVDVNINLKEPPPKPLIPTSQVVGKEESKTLGGKSDKQ